MKIVILGILASTMVMTSIPVLAEHGERFERGHWEGRDIHRFGEHDLRVWRGGSWRHGWHGGRLGWWWIAGGIWYFYPAPVYPYPDPYVPPVVAVSPQPVAPQTVVPAPAQPQQTAKLWYYCDSAKGYYPYVPSCSEGWRAVPAEPTPQPAPQIAPPMPPQ
jgi:hypothetical protein